MVPWLLPMGWMNSQTQNLAFGRDGQHGEQPETDRIAKGVESHR